MVRGLRIFGKKTNWGGEGKILREIGRKRKTRQVRD
jgi:hypothetical protein